MARSDWIPAQEQKLMDLARVWEAALSDPANRAAFDWDAAVCAAIVAAVSAFLSAHAGYLHDDSSRNCLIKKEARAELIRLMRDFANVAVRFNKKVHPDMRLRLGIRIRDTKLSRPGAPVEMPSLVVLPTGNHWEHKLYVLNYEKKRVKPAGVFGVRYAWQVGGTKPEAGSELPKSKFSQRMTAVLGYTELDEAKTVYYAARYENSRGDAGPWSPLRKAVIG